LEVSGGPGTERARVELTPDDPAPAKPGRGHAPGKARKSGKAGRQVERVAAVVVEFALANVVKAKLVPEVDFRGRNGAAGANLPGANTGSKKQ
jgi:hypothetical protein